MGLLEKLFPRKTAEAAVYTYFKTLGGYAPVYTSFEGGVYEMALTRACIHTFATHVSKLKPVVKGPASRRLERTLQFQPNPWMDTKKYLYRLATIDHVEIPQGRVGRLQGVGLNAGHPGVELVAADILLAQPEGRLAHIGQHHPAAWHVGSHRQTHAAAPGAQIQHPRPLSGGPGQQDGPLGQHLGVHPGDQHVGGDIQAQAIELPLPDEVGHRLPGQPPLQQLRQLLLHRVGGIKGHIPVKLLPALAGRTADQLPRLQLGALHAGLSQPLAGIQVEVVVRGRHTETTPLSLSN